MDPITEVRDPIKAGIYLFITLPKSLPKGNQPDSKIIFTMPVTFILKRSVKDSRKKKTRNLLVFFGESRTLTREVEDSFLLFFRYTSVAIIIKRNGELFRISTKGIKTPNDRNSAIDGHPT